MNKYYLVSVLFLVCFTEISGQDCSLDQAEQYYTCLKDVQDNAAKSNENIKTMKKCFTDTNCKPAPRIPLPIEQALQKQREKTEKCANESVEILNACVSKKPPQFPIPQNTSFFSASQLDPEVKKLPNCTDDQARNVTLCFFQNAKPQNATQLLVDSCMSMKSCYQSKLSASCRSLFEKSKSDSCACYKSEKVGSRFHSCVQQALGVPVLTVSLTSSSEDSAFCSQADICESPLITGAQGKGSLSRVRRHNMANLHDVDSVNLEPLVKAFMSEISF